MKKQLSVLLVLATMPSLSHAARLSPADRDSIEQQQRGLLECTIPLVKSRTPNDYSFNVGFGSVKDGIGFSFGVGPNWGGVLKKSVV